MLAGSSWESAAQHSNSDHQMEKGAPVDVDRVDRGALASGFRRSDPPASTEERLTGARRHPALQEARQREASLVGPHGVSCSAATHPRIAH
jgi:hypothetical protein